MISISGHADCDFDNLSSPGCKQWNLGQFQVISASTKSLKTGPTGDASLHGR